MEALLVLVFEVSQLTLIICGPSAAASEGNRSGADNRVCACLWPITAPRTEGVLASLTAPCV